MTRMRLAMRAAASAATASFFLAMMLSLKRLGGLLVDLLAQFLVGDESVEELHHLTLGLAVELVDLLETALEVGVARPRDLLPHRAHAEQLVDGDLERLGDRGEQGRRGVLGLAFVVGDVLSTCPTRPGVEG